MAHCNWRPFLSPSGADLNVEVSHWHDVQPFSHDRRMPMAKERRPNPSAGTVKTTAVMVRPKVVGKPLTADRWAVNRTVMELLLARGTPLRPTAEVVAWNGPLKHLYRTGNALRSALWFALLTAGDEVIASESSFPTCWGQVVSVGALAVQISGRSAPTIMRNVSQCVNVRTKVVYLALPSAGGEPWSVRRVAMLAHTLPKGIALVLDMSDSYSSPLDMFDLRGHTFGPNVIVVPPLSRPRMVGVFKQSGDRAPLSLKLVAALNKFIGSLTVTDGATEERRTRRAAFNLFWSAKTACKLSKLW